MRGGGGRQQVRGRVGGVVEGSGGAVEESGSGGGNSRYLNAFRICLLTFGDDRLV